MRLPGFTAEVSLSGKRAAYKVATRPLGEVGVLPQFWYCHGNYCCDEWGYCIRKGGFLM